MTFWEALQKPLLPSRMEQKCSVQFFLTTPGGAVFYQHNSKILLWSHSQSGCSMEELFNGQLSFADIEAEKFLQIRRTHADRRVNAMDRLTDDVINELIQLCLPLYQSWKAVYAP